MNSKETLHNRRCFISKRCSTNGQADTSISNQNMVVDKLVADHGMTVVGEYDAAGVTGSVPGARDDIDEIIRLKRSGLDFDLLILPTTDRFTRAGALHGSNILWELQGEGIDVYFVAEQLWSCNRMHQNLLSFLFGAARQTAESISRGATLGVTNSYLNGRSPHTRRPPYGTDRVYSVDGKDLHVIRNLADGTQQMLDPQTKEVIRTFGQNPKKGTPAHYIKQKNEQVRLIPGAPERIAAVVLICRCVHVERRSIHSIAKELNDAGILSPHGKAWDWSVVKSIAFNPVYVGMMIRGRTTKAIYYSCDKNGIVESKVTENELREHKRPPTRERPVEEWLVRDEGTMADFLPEDVRDITRHAIERHLEQKASNEPKPKTSRDPHGQSRFILKDVLRSKQGNRRMSGKVCGRGGDRHYYRIAAGQNCPKTDNLFGRTVPATPLNMAILDVISDCLSNTPELEKIVRESIEAVINTAPTAASAEQIERDIRRRQKQINAALDQLMGDPATDKPIEEKLAVYRADIAKLTGALRNLPKTKPMAETDTTVQAVIDSLRQFDETRDEQDNELIRQMVGLLVSKMEVDLLTREVELELHLPDWFIKAFSNGTAMSLAQGLAWKTPNAAHQSSAPNLGQYRCRQTSPRPVCFECRRVRKAA